MAYPWSKMQKKLQNCLSLTICDFHHLQTECTFAQRATKNLLQGINE